MTGAIVIAIAVIVVLPVGMLMSGAVLSAVLGWRLKEEAEIVHEGSELIETNR